MESMKDDDVQRKVLRGFMPNSFCEKIMNGREMSSATTPNKLRQQ